jgi:hypothetical protein
LEVAAIENQNRGYGGSARELLFYRSQKRFSTPWGVRQAHRAAYRSLADLRLEITGHLKKIK